jgi:MFS family permease
MIATFNERILPLRVLRHRSFALVWAGQSISTIGDGIYRVALAWSVLLLTGSALAMGTVYLASLAPTIILTLVGGVAADRLPRRLIMLWSDGGRGVIVALVAALALSHLLQFWHLLVLSLLFGVADGFFMPSYQAIVPQLVEGESLQSANTLMQSSTELCRILGPVIGASLLAATASASLSFALDAVSFFVSVGCLMAFHLPPAAEPASESVGTSQDAPVQAPGGIIADIREGLRYVRGQRWLWITIVVAAITNICYSVPLAAVLPKLVADFYHAGAGLFGLLVSADAAGYLVATLLMLFVHPRRRGIAAYGLVTVSWIGLITLGLPLPREASAAVAMIACMCVGFGIGVFTVIEVSLIQELVPERLLGRVMSVDMVGSYLLLPIGLVTVGWVADHFGPAPIFVAGGICSLLFTVIGLCVRDIRRLE